MAHRPDGHRGWRRARALGLALLALAVAGCARAESGQVETGPSTSAAASTTSIEPPLQPSPSRVDGSEPTEFTRVDGRLMWAGRFREGQPVPVMLMVRLEAPNAVGLFDPDVTIITDGYACAAEPEALAEGTAVSFDYAPWAPDDANIDIYPPTVRAEKVVIDC